MIERQGRHSGHHLVKIFIMRILIIVAALLCAQGVLGQDYCKQIKKEVTDNNTSFSYESPYNEDSPPAIRVMRAYSTNPDAEFDNFNLIFTIPCEFSELLEKKDGVEAEKEELKVVIEFDDKSKIVDDTTQISHEKKPDGSALRSAIYPITPENLKKFTGKKIVKFHLATAEATVTPEMATAIEQYIICLKAVKK